MAKKKGKKKEDGVSLDVPSHLKVSKVCAEPRREEYTKLINEYMQLMVAADYRQRTGHVDDFIINEVDDFPTLQVGYLARAVGLNVSDAQVIDIVSIVEVDDASSGYVLQDRLRLVLLDALMTGMIGGPTLYGNGLLPRTANRAVQPSCCLREDERHIFRAFRTIDKTGKGFLTEDELRQAMLEHGDSFTEMELDEMIMAAADPESGNIYYKNFADILAHE